MKSFFFTCCLLTCLQAFAQDSLRPAQKGSWVILPALSTSPETGLSFGALAMHLRKLGKYDTLSRPSNIQAFLIYTVKGQILFSPSYTLIWDKERYFLNGNLSYFQFPEFYYGIGNQTDKQDQETVSYSMLRLENRFLRQIAPHLFAGIQQRFLQISQVERKEGGLLEETRPFGYNGSVSSGLGPALLYDSRNNVVNATQGLYAELTTLFHQDWMGSQAHYQFLRTDLRTYLPLHKSRLGHWILALQAQGIFTDGTPPVIRQFAELGSDVLMRGYYRGRYRDRQLLAAQAELRFPLVWILGMTAFAGLGEVAPKIADFNIQHFKPNYGAGLRIRVNNKENVNIRIDYGLGYRTSGIYFQIGEAF
jgi:outer membrane protein assembly factor BamA